MHPFPRIAALMELAVGNAPDESALRRLVDAQVSEADDLDFKEQPYNDASEPKAEIAKDITALANLGGGMLIIGISDQDGRASKLCPFAGRDKVERRIRQLTASSAFPLPEYQVIRVDSAADPAKGYLIVAVPQSSLAPHAVSPPAERNKLMYHVRNGSSTRMLSEAEVADRYRGRFRSAESDVDDLLAIYTAAASTLWPEGRWLSLTMVPRRRGDMRIRRASAPDVRTWAGRTRSIAWARYWEALDSAEEACIAVRSIRISQRFAEDGVRARGQRAQLYTGGGAFLAAELISSEEGPPARVSDLALVDNLFCMLDLAAHHAIENCGVSGDALCEVRLATPFSEPRAAVLAYQNAGPVWSARELRESVVAIHEVNLDAIVESTQEALAATRLLLTDVFQAFGQASPRQIGDDGSIYPDAFGVVQRSVREWALANGVSTGAGPAAPD